MMKRLFFLLLLSLTALLLPACDLLPPPVESDGSLVPDAPQFPELPGEQGEVVEVIDGDTIEVRIDGRTVPVRYIGIDTPERDEPCYDEAAAANAAYVAGRTVRLVRDTSDTDRYDRLLRYVYVDDLLINAELVAGGWAESRRYRPDDALYDFLEGLERTAVAEQRGCHPFGSFPP